MGLAVTVGSGSYFFVMHSPIRRNIPLKRRVGRAASRARWLFPTRLMANKEVLW